VRRNQRLTKPSAYGYCTQPAVSPRQLLAHTHLPPSTQHNAQCPTPNDRASTTATGANREAGATAATSATHTANGATAHGAHEENEAGAERVGATDHAHPRDETNATAVGAATEDEAGATTMATTAVLPQVHAPTQQRLAHRLQTHVLHLELSSPKRTKTPKTM
jgi:hypothetical protein